MTVKRPFQPGLKRKAASKRSAADSRVPRVSKLMALAICFEQLIREGVVADQAELARLGQVSRARLTQVMDLLNLAPEIQGQILGLQPDDRTREIVTERALRRVTSAPDWQKQRGIWRSLISRKQLSKPA
jgi:hypothetical protein